MYTRMLCIRIVWYTIIVYILCARSQRCNALRLYLSRYRCCIQSERVHFSKFSWGQEKLFLELSLFFWLFNRQWKLVVNTQHIGEPHQKWCLRESYSPSEDGERRVEAVASLVPSLHLPGKRPHKNPPTTSFASRCVSLNVSLLCLGIDITIDSVFCIFYGSRSRGQFTKVEGHLANQVPNAWPSYTT